MFFNYLKDICGIGVYKRLIFLDSKNIINDEYLDILGDKSCYKVLFYNDVLEFRYLYEKEIKKSNDKYLVIVKKDIYIPYDVRQAFYMKELNYKILFPKLNTYILENSFIFDLDLLYIAHENLYRIIGSEEETRRFLNEVQFNNKNIEEYKEYLLQQIEGTLDKNNLNKDYISPGLFYKDWFKIAILYSKLEYIEQRCGFKINYERLKDKVQEALEKFIIENYSDLSGYSVYKGPVLLNKALDYIFLKSKKPALIVMDCMSITDWLIISEGLAGIKYEYNSVFAIIPTITSISRQSLLSGRLPAQQRSPFTQTYEKNQFIEKCKDSGYKDGEIKYHRGYDIEIDYKDRVICVIINDIDELAHSQKQGDKGMYNDVKLLSESGKIYKLIKKLYESGFDVFITSDHGHIETETMGNPKGIGVELETKSKRTMVLKDFADYEGIVSEFGMIEFPPYYLPKEYKYLLCKYNKSFGIKGNITLSHGGISIQEVIIPFVKVEGVEQ